MCVPDFLGRPNFETVAQRIDWFGTSRVRLGWTNGPVLFYATGGFAYGDVKTELNYARSGGPDMATGNFSQNKSGWTVGAGIEAQLVGNWTGKLEYLYVDLGTVAGAAPNTGTSGGGAAAAAFSSRIQDHIVRAGVNYRLGDPGVIAKY